MVGPFPNAQGCELPPKSTASFRRTFDIPFDLAADPPKPISKQAQLAALVARDTGATLDQMIELTGWLPHTTRAALTGLKKKGYAISSDKIDGVRTYRAVAPEVA